MIKERKRKEERPLTNHNVAGLCATLWNVIEHNNHFGGNSLTFLRVVRVGNWAYSHYWSIDGIHKLTRLQENDFVQGRVSTKKQDCKAITLLSSDIGE